MEVPLAPVARQLVDGPTPSRHIVYAPRKADTSPNRRSAGRGQWRVTALTTTTGGSEIRIGVLPVLEDAADGRKGE